MNSPWGLFNMISDKKGWSHEYMMEGISWTNLQMYMADQIRMVKRGGIVRKVDKNDIKKLRERYKNG